MSKKNNLSLAVGASIFFSAVSGFCAEPTGTLSRKMSEAVQPVTVEEEIEIGRGVAANVIAQFGFYEDELLTSYVNMVGLVVAQASFREGITYRFAILDSPVLNAFAAPGGYIFITRGLLFSLKNEAQLAGVLAHEVAHVSQKHVIKEIQKARIAQAAIPSYIKATAKKAHLMSQVTDLAIGMIWKGLSREDELESDRLGIQYVSAVGYQAREFKDVLETLRARSQNQDKNKELKFLLSTHPKLDERIQVVSQKLETVPQTGMELEDRFSQVFAALP